MRRRIILIVLVIVVILAGLFYVTRVRGSSGAANKPSTGTPRATAVHGTSIADAGTPAIPTATPLPKNPAAVTAQKRALDVYATGLVPILARGVGVFDRITNQAKSTGNLGKLSQLCFGSLKPLGIAQAQAEGVAHPYPWWSPVGKFHHSLMGIYHDMVGATDSCSVAAGNGQGSDASAAVAIMSQQDQALRKVQSHVISLSKGPK